jgi:hypothetical protein
MQNTDYEDMAETEREVAHYFGELGLQWVFESPVFVYDDRGRPRVWAPDFYLPTLGMYVEVWSSANKSHRYREDVYIKNGYRVVFVHCFGAKKWREFLVKRIMAIEDDRHSEIMKMFRALRLE